MDQFTEMSTSTVGSHITPLPGTFHGDFQEAERQPLKDPNIGEFSSGLTSKRGHDEETNLGNFHRLRNCTKSHSTPAALKWLDENYEIAEAVCIPRSTLYCHYLDYCETNDTQPVNAASFGKIIRQQFPQITTRRLGTRGQSKYHYYGIGVRETSKHFEIIYSSKGAQSLGEGKKENVKQIVAYSPRSKLGTLLPDFPDIKDIKLPDTVPEDKVVTFLMMYRTHCQRILDTVIRANFDEVQSFLLHFWQGMPGHMMAVLDTQTIVLLVGVCDTMLYKAIANVLMPTVLQALPESLIQVIKKFSKQLDEWLKIALDSLPNGVRKMKFDLARRFAQVLRRQTSLNHLCQAARSVVHSPDISSQMLEDWISVDLNSIIKQTVYTMESYNEKVTETIANLCYEFEQLLEDQAPLQSYVEWLDNMVDKCVVQYAKKRPGFLRRTARQFLLMWSCFGTRVIRDMTLHSAPSFGSFHLLHLMFDDYVLYLVENLYSEERSRDFLRHIRGEITDLTDDEPLPDYSIIKEAFMASEPRECSTETNMEVMESSVYKKNIGNERVTISPRTRFESSTYECTHSTSEDQRKPFLKQVSHSRSFKESGIFYETPCNLPNDQISSPNSNNNAIPSVNCFNQDQGYEMNNHNSLFMDLPGNTFPEHNGYTTHNNEFSFQHFFKNDQNGRGSFNQPTERVSIPQDGMCNYGYTTGHCYGYHSAYTSRRYRMVDAPE
ncbi:transcription factor RFX4-like [Saccostrea cucullata]|uniref:transcription factor RFX4-like n=1 Tax=Saccostrea cuccullata TaxID=36930 RepID=UPI002ECFD9C1